MKIKFIETLNSIIIMQIFLISACYSKQHDPMRKRVILIGIDSIFINSINKTDHSIFDFMMKEGSYSLNTRTTIQSMSGPGWSSILCGMDTEDTGITDNDWYPPWMFGGKIYQITPLTGDSQPFPCIFSELKKNDKNLSIKITYDWNFFIFLGNLSIPGSVDKEDYCDTAEDTLSAYDDCDNQMLRNTLLNIQQDFDMMFVYFGSVDKCGHEKGFDSADYINYVGKINKYIEIIFDQLKSFGIFNNTYIIITADHGVQPETKWHGEWNDININTPWFVVGPDIRKSYMIKSKMKNSDTAPTIMRIFGYKPNVLWRSRVVSEIFLTEKEKLFKRYKSKLNIQFLSNNQNN